MRWAGAIACTVQNSSDEIYFSCYVQFKITTGTFGRQAECERLIVFTCL